MPASDLFIRTGGRWMTDHDLTAGYGQCCLRSTRTEYVSDATGAWHYAKLLGLEIIQWQGEYCILVDNEADQIAFIQLVHEKYGFWCERRTDIGFLGSQYMVVIPGW